MVIQVSATLADGGWPIQAVSGGAESASSVILSVKTLVPACTDIAKSSRIVASTSKKQ